jgi:hypothetical protein
LGNALQLQMMATRPRVFAIAAALGAAALGVVWLLVAHEPYVSVLIEDCGKRRHFIERLRRAGVGYSAGQDGKLTIQVRDLDELAARLGGKSGLDIPDSAATGRVGGDCQ